MKDLHIHTKYSDGELDEFEIVDAVIDAGIKEFAICDHDTVEGSKKVFDVVLNKNVGVVFHSGVELTCRLNEFNGGVNMHLLFMDFDYDNKNIKTIIKNISQLRLAKVDKMVKYVEDVYKIQIPKDKLRQKLKSTNSFGKPHLYSIMCELGDFDREQYYRIMDKLDVDEFKLSSSKTIKMLNGCGKIYLAHPIEIMKEYGYNITKIEQIICMLKDFGLCGVETHHSEQTKQLQKQLSNIAKKYGLLESMGSDFHGANVKPGLNIGDVCKKK